MPKTDSDKTKKSKSKKVVRIKLVEESSKKKKTKSVKKIKLKRVSSKKKTSPRKRKSIKSKRVSLPKNDSSLAMEIKVFLLEKKSQPITLQDLKEKTETGYNIVLNKLKLDLLEISKIFEKLPNENGTVVKWTVLSFEFKDGSFFVKVQKANGAKILINKETDLKTNIREYIDSDKCGFKGWMKEKSKILKKDEVPDWNFKKAHIKLGLKIVVMIPE